MPAALGPLRSSNPRMCSAAGLRAATSLGSALTAATTGAPASVLPHGITAASCSRNGRTEPYLLDPPHQLRRGDGLLRAVLPCLDVRRVPHDRPRVGRLEKLFADDKRGLRERVLWRMLYEAAARAEEILTLNVEDLDPEFRRARVKSKGGAVEYVHWATGTARILPRLLRGRTSGPVFLADRRAPASGPRAPSAEDTCPVTGRGRLSYPRAEYLFKQASKTIDPHRKGWTLHQLRHSALQHLAADGRTAPELQAKSRHQHLASLGRRRTR
jgi:integrase